MHRVFPPTNNQHNLVDLSHPNNNKKIPLSSQDLKNMWFRNLHESVRYHSLKSSPQKFRKYGAWKTGTKWPIFRCFFAVRMFVSGTGSYQLKRVSVGEETLTWPFSWTQVCVFFFCFFVFFVWTKAGRKTKGTKLEIPNQFLLHISIFKITTFLKWTSSQRTHQKKDGLLRSLKVYWKTWYAPRNLT